MKRISFEDKELVETCREIYLKYLGRKHRQIEAEVRGSGWPEFSRRRMYNTTVRGVQYVGWIERFGWKQEVERLKSEIEERAAGRTTFEDWLLADPSGMRWTARHHAFICENLRRITDGTSKRLMIFVPPRHGKSELVTVRYISWRLIRNVRMNVIIGCYNQKLANRFSRKIKQLTTGRVVRSHQRHAAEEWETAAGGSVKAVGVGSGITGFGGDLIVLDDPVKGRAAANSRNLRDKTWDWYNDDIQTRLEPGAAVVLIQTRWHDDDLAGRLLKEMQNGGEQWDVVRLPALAESKSNAFTRETNSAENSSSTEQRASGSDETTVEVCSGGITPEGVTLTSEVCSGGFTPEGVTLTGDPLGRAEDEALWPERFDREELLAKRRQMGPWSFAALYQQRPVPEGGTLFRIEWFARRVSRAPEGLRWCRGYDLAVSLKTSADFTASFRCAIDARTGDMYIADGFRKRLEYPDQKKFVLDRMASEPDTRHGIEMALHGQALIQDLRREPAARGRVLRGIKVDSDKLIRAEAWAALAAEGKVVLVEGPWVHEFLDEVCRFSGRGDAHDDQVDAVSLAYRMLGRGKGFESFE